MLHNFLSVYQTNKVEDFRKIKSILFNFHHHFNQSEKHDLVDILKYFFYSKRHETDVTKELFEIVKFSLKEGLLLEDGYITSQSFINCIFIAKRNKKNEWIENFINQYQPFLNLKVKVDIVLFSEAILAFEKREYINSLKKLTEIRPNNVVNSARIYCLKLQCYYELDNEKSFYHLINSSKQYLFNHKDDFIIERDFSMFKNFITKINQIYKIHREVKLAGKANKLEITNILQQFYKVRYTTYTEWLIEKLEEIRDTLSE